MSMYVCKLLVLCGAACCICCAHWSDVVVRLEAVAKNGKQDRVNLAVAVIWCCSQIVYDPMQFPFVAVSVDRQQIRQHHLDEFV